MQETRLAVLGAGKMGGALVRGWVKENILHPSHIRVFNRRPETTLAIAEETGTIAAPTARDAVTGADCVLIGVKPYLAVDVLSAIAPFLSPKCLVLCIAAGIKTASLEAVLAAETPVIRVMSNIPALLGEGASAFCRGKYASAEDAALVSLLFAAVGSVVEVLAEAQIDAVTGIAGSGVAFFYLLIEAMIDGGVGAGLPRDAARTLAAQTALGAARMILESNVHPGALKDAVTTPGGTTMAGLAVLEKAGIRGTLIEAVIAARDRARELG